MNRAAVALVLGAVLGAAPAHAEAVRLLVSIGNDIGDPEDPPLQYADADARRVLALFVDIGNVSADRAYLLENQPLSVLRERLAEVKGRAGELRAEGKDVVLFLYVSSHAKGGVLHIAGDHLPLAELRSWLETTGARLRLIIVDACDSAAAARQKGGKPAPDYEVSLRTMPLTGEVLLASSGPAEPSQEWDSLGGSLFTHSLLTGLRGDADIEGDGLVTLSEAYAYAYRQTVGEASHGGQHPAYDINLVGTGELVLSEPGKARSALVFPAPLQGHYIIASQPRMDVVLEVDKIAGKSLRLAIPPGRYLLRKPEGSSVGLLSIELPYGGERQIDESQMTRQNYREVTMKGGTLEMHPFSLAAEVGVDDSPIVGYGPEYRIGLGMRRSYGSWLLLAQLDGTQQSYAAPGIGTQQQSLSGEVAWAYRGWIGPFMPYAGLGVRLIAMRQSFTRSDESQIDTTSGQGPLPDRWGLGVAAGPVAGIEVPAIQPTFVFVEGELQERYLPVEGQSGWSVGVEGAAGFGVQF